MRQIFKLYLFLGAISPIITSNNSQDNINCTDHSVNFCKIYNFNIEKNAELPLKYSPHINDLIIHDSFIPELKRMFFFKVPNLLMLIMNRCNLSKLFNYDFMHLKNLETLILQYNSFNEVPDEMFTEISNLTRLYMGFNNISILHPDSFTHLPYLTYLDLQHNQIDHAFYFHSLHYLQYIDLSYNKINYIDKLVFDRCTRLKTILLKNNQIQHLSPTFFNSFSNLKLVDVSNNPNIEEVNIKYIDTLHASNCSLKFCRIERGYKINVASNQLLELGIDDKLSVRDLQLHDNLFDSMEEFDNMLNLAWLDLSNNIINKISTRFDGNYLELPSLTYLNLANNLMHNIDRIAENLLPLQKLLFLDLTGNNLSVKDKEDIRMALPNLKTFVTGDQNELQEYLSYQPPDQHQQNYWIIDRKFILLCIVFILLVTIVVIILYRFYKGLRICPFSNNFGAQNRVVHMEGSDVPAFE